jgi:Protein of unknown function (DUF998)
MTGWRTAGRCCAAAGWLLWVVVQVVAKDPFPPEISLSQYGLGSAGWLFSLWVVVLAGGPLLLFRYRPVPGAAGWLLAIGFAGTVLMAIVRTDEGGQQTSWHAMVHMAGAVIALVFLPFGMGLVLRYAARPWPAVAVATLGTAVVIGVLVLVSAAGVDTAGMGPARSWALWQSVLVVIEMVLVTLYAAVVSTIDPRSRRAGRSTPVQSAIR